MSFMTNPKMNLFVKNKNLCSTKATLAIICAIQGTSFDKIYQELGPQSFKSRRCYKRLNCMSKKMKERALINLVPKCEPAIRTRNNSIPELNSRTVCFKYSYFPSTLKDWFNLDLNIRHAEYVSLFKKRLLSFICNYKLYVTISYIKNYGRFCGFILWLLY